MFEVGHTCQEWHYKYFYYKKKMCVKVSSSKHFHNPVLYITLWWLFVINKFNYTSLKEFFGILKMWQNQKKI